jgi:hypothetical protein
MAEEKTGKLVNKEKVGVTVMLILITAATFLAIGYWAGARDAEDSTSCVSSITSLPPVPDEPTAVAE